MLVFSPCSVNFPEAENEFQKEVFDFCRAWKSGQQDFVFYTSGSTGTPKQIVISREKMIFSANLTANWLNLKENDFALLCLPIHYIAGAMVLVRALVLNLKLVLIEPSKNPLEELIKSGQKIDLASFVPTQWAQMMNNLDSLEVVFGQAKGILLGGASLDVQLEKKTRLLNFPVFHTYAMTETVSHIGYRSIKDSDLEQIYQVFPSTEIEINDKCCLKIKSFLTNNEWLDTNDLVEIISPHSFKLLGRNDFIINSGGFKINPFKVEIVCQAFFESINLTLDLFLFGVKDEFYGQKAILFVNNKAAVPHFEELKGFLKQTLDSKEVPKDCFYLSSFEINDNGKIDRIKTVNLYFNQQNNVN
ncbi:AMP-binding protein [Aquirufa sp. ROCK-SH2]